jgi:RNA polymerase sigma factor (sigma-70 family)
MQTLSAPRPGLAARPPGVALRLASDERLARWAADGRDGAMAAIFERHHQALHRYCHSILGHDSDAADALQNTMLKALRSLPGETRRIALKPWLYRIAHNEAISLLRARRPQSDLDAAAHVSDLAAAGRVESRERLRELTGDLGELTERQRAALLMRELGGLAFADVADAMSTSPEAVKQSVYEARRALQSMQEGRAMDCEAVRHTISDGDKRMLRGMRMRGHLRSCAGCRDFEAALAQRPQQLAAMIPPLPVAAAAGMLHAILGGGGAAAGGGGGGLLAGLIGSAKATTAASLGAKATAAIAVSATLTGGAVYVVPELGQAGPEHRGAPAQRSIEADAGALRDAQASRLIAVRRSPAAGVASTSEVSSQTPAAAGGASRAPGAKPAGTPAGEPASDSRGRPFGIPAGGRPSSARGADPGGTPGAKRARGRKPATTPTTGRRPSAPSADSAETPPARAPNVLDAIRPGRAGGADPTTVADRGSARTAAAPDGP